MMKRNLTNSALLFLLALALLFVPAMADADNDYTGVFGQGAWFVKDPDSAAVIDAWSFGVAGDIPFVLPDGDTGVFGQGVFFVRNPDTGDVAHAWPFGAAGDRPFVLPDGSVGVFGNGGWYVRDMDTGAVAESWAFGAAGDKPFVLPDGTTGVFSDGQWETRDPVTGEVDDSWHFGAAGDRPFVLSDGRVGVFGQGAWFVRAHDGGIDDAWSFGSTNDEPFVLQELPPPPGPTVITAIVPIDDSVAVSYGTSLSNAIAAINAQTAYEGVVENPGNVPLDIEDWTSGTYDPESEGDHTFTGQATAPEGYEFADGVDTTVTATVTVGDRPDDMPITQVVPQSTSVDRDTPKADIEFPAKATTKAGTTWYNIDVEWDDESTPVYNGFVPGDYVFEGTLINLPAYVTNPDEMKAEFTVTVRDTVTPGTVYVSTYQEWQVAIDDRAERIILEGDITLGNGLQRIEYDLKVLDLGGFTITLGNRPLAFMGDGTTIRNGKISGYVTWWGLDSTGAPVEDSEWWANWRYERKVMISGDGVTFDDIIFDVDVADWYQTQEDKTASDLTIRNSALYGMSLFNSDVYIVDTDVYNRIGIQHDDAILNKVEYKINDKLLLSYDGTIGSIYAQPSMGIVYVNSDATLIDNIWNAGRAVLDVVVGGKELVKPVTVDYDYATGMFVGKSLKYYGEYSEAQPSLIRAEIISDKYAFVYWALNYHKARLWTTGDILVSSGEGGGGLMVVGTDHRDYKEGSDDRPGTEFEGGQIVGTGTFKGAPVYIGKPTEGYAKFAGYPGAATLDIESKDPWCINRTEHEKIIVDVRITDKYGSLIRIDTFTVPVGPWCDDNMVDYQCCQKDADRLYITGQTFVSPAYIFTPANEYINCTGQGDGQAPLDDPVWFGTLTFDKIQLWGDFDIIRDKTVTFNEIRVMCGNIRRIGTEKNISGQHKDCHGWQDFSEGGILTGGIIRSDTKKNNTLVFGDGLMVRNVVLDKTLYNVILESAWLENVDMYVGDGNRNDARVVCGIPLEGDIFVWPYNVAAISNSMFSGSTRIVTKNEAALRLANNVDNRGILIFEPLAGLYFIDANLYNDIRDAGTINIREVGNRAHIDVDFDIFAPYWSFENWKLDIIIQADDRVVSTKYRLDWLPLGKQDIKIPDDIAEEIENWLNDETAGGYFIDGFDPETDHFNFTLNKSTWYFDYGDPEYWSWDITEGAYVREILGVGHKHAFSPLLEEYEYGGDLELRLSAAADRTFELTVKIVGINCCTRELIDFGTATKEVVLLKKFECTDYNDAITTLANETMIREYWWPIGHEVENDEFNEGVPNAFWLFGWKVSPYDGYIIIPPSKFDWTWDNVL